VTLLALFTLFGKGLFMHDLQIGGNSTKIGDKIPNSTEKITVSQENQMLPLPPQSFQITEQLRVQEAHMVDLLCILLITFLVTASAVAFCVTRSMLSFSFLTLLSLLPSLRRRKEEAIFPISENDFRIKLKELDVEIERIRKQNSTSKLTF
jgi:hypothetical protein